MRLVPVLVGFLLAAACPAQNTAVVPALLATLPGNAATSMPLRWSQGVMQVVIDHALIPGAACTGGIQGLRLRRPAFFGEPAYGAITRMLTVRAAVTQTEARHLQPYRDRNTPTTVQIVFGPAPVTIAATPAFGRGDALGPELLTIPFAVPIALPNTGDHLYLEFETSDTAMQVDAGNWVDAVQFENGVDAGYDVPVGNGGCGSQAVPMTLQWTGAAAPARGTTAALQMVGAPANSFAVALLSFDPQARAPGGSFFGFGADLGGFGMTGCHQWSALDYWLNLTTSNAGIGQVGFAIPTTNLRPGDRLGVQVAVLDPAANAAGVSMTNGVVLVLDQSGVGNQAASVFYPGPTTPTSLSPWRPYVGLMPVLVLEY